MNTANIRLLILSVLLLIVCPLSGEEFLRIDKNAMRGALINRGDTLANGGDTLMLFPISCGRGYGHKHKKNDLRTPEGTYTIIGIQDASAWGHDFLDGHGYIKHAYGPWFFRLSFGSGIGIHGTHDPGSMGLRASEGCIRLLNEDLQRLRSHVHKGMRVEILPDTAVHIPTPMISLIPVAPPVLEFGKDVHSSFGLNPPER